MPIYKEVWQFKSAQAGAWNEVYYCEQPSLTDAATFEESFITRRLNLLHSSNTWTKVRISDIATPRVSTIKTINRAGTGSDVGSQTGPANLDEAAVLTLASSERPSSRKVWMRGCPEGYVFRTAGGQTETNGIFDSALKAFLDGLCKPLSGYCVLTRKRIGQEGISRYDVSGIDATVDPGYAIVTTTAAHALLADQYAVFNLFSQKTFPGLKGAFRVLPPITATTFRINYRTVGDANYNVSRGYVFRREYWTGAKLNRSLCAFAYLGSRRSKNVDTGSRGARRATPLRHL